MKAYENIKMVNVHISQSVSSVTQLCPAVCNPMDCSLLGSSYPWDFPGKNTGEGGHFLLQGIFLTRGSKLHLLHWQVDSLPLNHQGNPTSYQFSCSVVSDSLRPHELQHARPPCPSPTPRAYPNSCPLSQWCHPTISSSVGPFSSRLQSFPTSGSFIMNQFFASGGQSTGVSASASVLPMNIQDWFYLGLTGWISLQSKEFSRVFSNHSSKASFFST